MTDAYIVLLSLLAWGAWCFYVGWKIRGDIDKSRKEQSHG